MQQLTTRTANASHIAPTLIGALILVILAALASAGTASAHAYPSQHWAAATCRETPINGQWAISSNVYMNRADGFPAGTMYVGGGDVFYGGGGAGPGNSQQWLYYRVVIVTQDRYGNWNQWRYGTWMRRLDALGDGTDGISTEVETYPGSNVYVRTGYGATGMPEDVSMLSGAIGSVPRTKFVYGQMYWGPIFSGTTRVFAPYNYLEPLGYLTCG